MSSPNVYEDLDRVQVRCRRNGCLGHGAGTGSTGRLGGDPVEPAAETSTTGPEPTSTVPDTTQVAAAPQSDDGSSSSDELSVVRSL